MKTTDVMKHLRNLMDLLADSHQDVANDMASLNGRMLQAAESKNNSATRFVEMRFETALKSLQQHRIRVWRIEQELWDLRKDFIS